MTVLEDRPFVELGLPDGPIDEENESNPFTSKIGGKPTLLFSSSILSDGLFCSRCKSTMYLLLQIDCPDDAEDIDRVIYVFICNTRECTESGVSGVVAALIQCQRRSKDPKDPKPSGLWASLDTEQITANLANLSMHSSAGIHLKDYPVSFPAIELRIIDELISTRTAAKTRTYPEKYMDQVWQGEVYETMQIVGYDKVFKNFHSRVAHYPRQVVRYSPTGPPLPFSAEALPQIDRCSRCGKSRRFDLQLMPAILSKLPVNNPKFLQHLPKTNRNKHTLYGDGMEWGTILVYTCGTCSVMPDGFCESIGQVIIQIENDLI